MGRVTDIIKGHLSEITKTNDELSDERFAICRECPLYKKEMYGEVCSSKIFANMETGETSKYAIEGYVRGCGCRLHAKTRLKTSKCPNDKW